jgi:8-hydroxy-5-deazaflavin:NADPH oxidoreductase
MLNANSSLAIIGGTGREGSALAARFAKAGLRIFIGSRDPIKAENAACCMNSKFNITNVEGYSNAEAAAKADIILLALPCECLTPICTEIKEAVVGKIVINIASSLDSEKKSRAKINPAGSIAMELQNLFGTETKIVDALQHVSPEQLMKFDEKIEVDVLVVGADRQTRNTVIDLIKKAGIDAFDAGTIENAVAIETLTAALIAINIRYKVTGSSIRIVGMQHLITEN